MSIKITVSKELDIDLNAYYPQFPKQLREAISEAIVDLAGGMPRKTPINLPPKTQGWGDTSRLTHDLRSARIGRAPLRHGAQMRAFHVLSREFGDNEFLMQDAKKALKLDGMDEKKISTMLANMWANEILIVNELK